MRSKIFWIILSLTGTMLAGAGPAEDADLLSHTLKAATAEDAFAELQADNREQPTTPAAWQVTAPTLQERQKYFQPYIASLADKATNFYTRFPGSAHAIDARGIEFQLVSILYQIDPAGSRPRLEAVAKSLANNPSAPDMLKSAAGDQLKQLEMTGKPIALQFTAVDGRPVDLAALKGKVVLIDFWATWCPPCRGEVPNVKKTYDQFHGKGFEIIGISLDKEKDKLTQFTADNQMSWPQYFDGLYWQNKYARQFGIDSIPAMWLIDKKGNLRTMNGREDLSGQVEKLLAE
jgi:thiol-disulfide isomerase/thioredoxin